MRPLLVLALFVAPLAATACGNTYHPEYHPVTWTNYQQHVSYPVTVQTGAQPAPVIVAPAPAPAPTPWAWPTE
jgi:hypothetical protein